MVIRRAALQTGAKLTVFQSSAAKSGFASQMQEILSGFKKAGLAPADVAALCEKLPPSSALRSKLEDISLLYGETEAYLASRYITTDDAFNEALGLIPRSFLRGIPVFIQGLDRPGKQLYSLLSAILSAASETTVSLRCDLQHPRDEELFAPDREIYCALMNLAQRLGMTVRELPLTQPGVSRAPALSYLEENLFAVPSPPYAGEADAITLFAATDRVAEAEWLGDQVLEQARRGVRYREMTVVVSDLEAYGGLLQRAFRRRGIPFFLDQKQPLTAHAAVDAVLSALKAACEGFPGGQLLRLAKTGYGGVSEDDTEELELFLLKTGFQGNALKKPFPGDGVPDGAQRARALLMEPLLTLAKGLLEKTVSMKTRALYRYLTDIRLAEQLSDRVNALLKEGRISSMEEHAQVWNTLMSLLSQMDAILGDAAVSKETFLQLFAEGLSGYSLGVIPGTADQVLLGDVARTQSRAVKTLFLVGVNDGLLPKPILDDGLFSDRELKSIAESGAPLWDGARAKAAAQRLDLYTVLSRGLNRLFLSYALSGDAGELSPSPLISSLLRLFPRCTCRNDLTETDALPASSRSGLFALTKQLSAFSEDQSAGPLLPSLVAYYARLPEYAVRVRHMCREARGTRPLEPLKRQQALLLYGRRIPMSASRLEQFGACPFKHFIRYGLHAADKQEYTEKATDLGVFYHACLEAFVRLGLSRRISWSRLTDGDADRMMDEVLPSIIAEHNGGIFLTNQRLKATLFLLIDTVKASARAVAAQLRAGAFTPLGAELRFGEGQPFPPVRLTLPEGQEALLSGVIDRADVAGQGEDRFLRVVDYKTGGREFDFAGILNGLTLQLPLYLAAATEGLEKAGSKPAGLYYMPLKIPALAEEEAGEAALQNAFRLRGLTLSQPSVLRLSDEAMDGPSQVLYGVRAQEENAYKGSICTREELEGLLAAAKKTAEAAFSGMLEGRIDISPVERACTYCDYRSICRFDPMVRGNRVRRYKKIKMEDFFALTGGNGHDLDR